MYASDSFKMKKLKFKKNKIIFLSTIIFVAVFYFSVNRAQNKICTVFAESDTYNETITCNGFAVRDEEIISTKCQNKKNMFFNCKSGDKIPKDSPVVKIYNDPSDVSESYKREYLENKIQSLGNAPYSYLTTGVSEANKKINKAIINMLISNSSLDLKNKERSTCDLWQALNKKACTIGSKDYLKEKIEDLKGKQYSVNVSSEKESILAPHCGKFIDHIDGFENKIPYGEILNVHSIEGISGDNVNLDGSILGKVIKKDTWYAIFTISDEEAIKVKGSTELYFNIEGKDNIENIPCEIKLLRKENDSGKYTFVFSCDYMNDALSKIRKEKFKIITKSISGIKIPQSSVRRKNDKENELGVFVDRAGYVKFKKINIIFSDSDFVISEYNSDFYNDENYIQPGDKIITSGMNLYEGKKVK